jgi:hypothetical protein
MARDDDADLAIRLGRVAEAVCRHYLPSGRQVGRYWIAGEVRGSPGRSMFVRLAGAERGLGAAGKWAEHVAATVMLRPCDQALVFERSAASEQHNGSAWRGIS